MNKTPIEIARQKVADQITAYKSTREIINRKYAEEKARVDGSLEALFETLNDLDKQLSVSNTQIPK